jgi:uncharacterized tellurite resistance protein B-like protein
MNEKKKEELGLLTQLVLFANADNEIKEVEFQFIMSIAAQMGVTPEEFRSIFETHFEQAPPKLEGDRIVQFHRLVLLMNVDLEVRHEEMDMIRKIGLKMGLNAQAIDIVLMEMHSYPNKVVPTERLIEIFSKYHN